MTPDPVGISKLKYAMSELVGRPPAAPIRFSDWGRSSVASGP